jgi:uncharacterized protein
VVVVLLLVAASVLVNLVLPGWAYPLCGLVVAAALLGVARWGVMLVAWWLLTHA